VKLWNVEISGTVLACFLDAATSVTTLAIAHCALEARREGHGAIDFAASLQRNTQIRKLSLDDLEDIFLSPILRRLASNSHVKELELNLNSPCRNM
jgi:hypothetical protein